MTLLSRVDCSYVWDEGKDISTTLHDSQQSTSYASYQNTNPFGKWKTKQKGNRLSRCVFLIIEY